MKKATMYQERKARCHAYIGGLRSLKGESVVGVYSDHVGAEDGQTHSQLYDQRNANDDQHKAEHDDYGISHSLVG